MDIGEDWTYRSRHYSLSERVKSLARRSEPGGCRCGMLMVDLAIRCLLAVIFLCAASYLVFRHFEYSTAKIRVVAYACAGTCRDLRCGIWGSAPTLQHSPDGQTLHAEDRRVSQ